MAAYVDYAYYSTTYGGTAIATAEFTAYANRASAYIDYVTMDRAVALMSLVSPSPEETALISKVKNAVCAVADQLHAYSSDGGIIASESVGSHSVTYADREKQTLTKKLSTAAYPFLAHTGGMFRGFNADEYSSYSILP